MNYQLSRRRAMQTAAAALTYPFICRAKVPSVERWDGQALGARASIMIKDCGEANAQALLRSAVAEIRRLEAIFSLYEPNSSVCRLNQSGSLDNPPLELVELLSISRNIHVRSEGAFDPTIQPLWQLYANYFRDNPDGPGPSKSAVEATRALVAFEQMEISPERVSFKRPEMGLSLNGIAQGYITDRIAELLRRAGARSALVNVGEIRALGGRPEDPFRVGLESSNDSTSHPVVELLNTAIATSSPDGFRFGGVGHHSHLFNVSRAKGPGSGCQVSVRADTATIADGLSTAFATMPVLRARQLAAQTSARTSGVTVWFNPGSLRS